MYNFVLDNIDQYSIAKRDDGRGKEIFKQLIRVEIILFDMNWYELRSN